MVERVLIGLLTGGHCLIEGVPGLAKTLTVKTLAQTLNATTHVTDAKALVAFLDSQAQVDTRKKLGTMGYCMGGPITMRTAAAVPGRVGAGASFHGGSLVTDQPDSPHLLAPKMRDVAIYVAGAVEDPSFPDDMKQRLEEALTAAGVEHRIETYAGMRHGWVPSDTPVHSPEGAERHFRALLDFYASTLK